MYMERKKKKIPTAFKLAYLLVHKKITFDIMLKL